MTITTDFNIFADKYHNREHLPRDLIKIIMDINTEIIKVEKNNLKNHKKKFNIVIRQIYDMSLSGEEGSDLLIYTKMFQNTDHKNIFVSYEGGPGSADYTEDLILCYDSIEDCINKVNGVNEWDLKLNTA